MAGLTKQSTYTIYFVLKPVILSLVYLNEAFGRSQGLPQIAVLLSELLQTLSHGQIVGLQLTTG